MSALRDVLRDLPDAVFADVLESDEAYLLVLDLPGVRADTLAVSVRRGRLRVEARREKDLPREFQYLSEDRALFLDADIPLPPDASAEGASGAIEKGVLEVRLPKRDRRAETSIPIDGETGDARPSDGGSDDTHGETDRADAGSEPEPDIGAVNDTETGTDAEDSPDDPAADS